MPHTKVFPWIMLLCFLHRANAFSLDPAIRAQVSQLLGTSTPSTQKVSSTILDRLEYLKSSCGIVLASQSPRRREIFDMMGINNSFDINVVVSNFEENLDKSSFDNPGIYAQINAECKAEDVYNQIRNDESRHAKSLAVVAADTIVDLRGKILEKPSDEQHAFQMLSELSGTSHLVHSGVALFTRPPVANSGASSEDIEPNIVSFYETTEVEIVPLSEDEIWAYIRTGEPMDKSGSYGIQGIGGQFVKGVRGCYFNVMGFPMHRFSAAMAELIQSKKI